MSQREKRIAELREYARQNYNAILKQAEEDIRRRGWVPTNEDFSPTMLNSPTLEVRGMVYRRPWGDFFWALVRIAEERYYVTEATAKSYAKLALAPFDADLIGKKYKQTQSSRVD